MRKMIAVVCVGLLTGAFVLSAQDAPKTSAPESAPALGRGGNAEMGIRMISDYLKQNDPKKYEEMQKLRQENLQEFRKKMAEIGDTMKEKTQKEREEYKALEDKYRETRSDADKAALRAKLEENMKKRIEFMKARVADEEKNMQANIDERLKQILSSADAEKEKKSEPAK